MHNKIVIKLRFVLFICELKTDTKLYFCHYSFFDFLISKDYGFRCCWERPEIPCSRKLDETCSKDYSVFLERYQGRIKCNWENIKQIFGEERRSRFCDIWAHSSQKLTSSTLSQHWVQVKVCAGHSWIWSLWIIYCDLWSLRGWIFSNPQNFIARTTILVFHYLFQF